MFKLILKQSYTTFSKKDSEIWKLPTLDFSVFEIEKKHKADFSKPIPLKLINKLADQAEDFDINKIKQQNSKNVEVTIFTNT